MRSDLRGQMMMQRCIDAMMDYAEVSRPIVCALSTAKCLLLVGWVLFMAMNIAWRAAAAAPCRPYIISIAANILLSV